MQNAATLGFDDTDGFDIALRHREDPVHGEVHELVVNGMFAMDSVDASSEVRLAELVDSAARRVLIGGLGLGFTAGTVLDRLPDARVTVAELSSALIGWARDGLVPSLARVATDPRCTLWHVDVAESLRTTSGWDAILLDVDNGPDFLIHDANAALYGSNLLTAARDALAPGGLLAIWCEQESPALHDELARLGDASLVTIPVDRDGHRIDYAIHCLRR
ncbi:MULTISPECIES: spermidine synthase [unclassified Luteococcus]|uniref:spermidine synthase n=1 Tax=unclassified Luteococcus TaxID=2639923 RepID=UPI00313C715A